MKRETIKKGVALLSVVAIFMGVVPSASAFRVDTTSSQWVSSDAVTDCINMTRSDAYSWVTGELNRISIECTSALDATSQPNASKVLSLYGAYLVYLSWAVSNVSYADGSNQWTVLQGEGDYDWATAQELIDGAEALRNKINEANILSSSTDIASGTFNTSSALGTQLPSFKSLEDGDAMFGQPAYYKGVVKLLTDYVDSQVLAVMAKHFEVTGSSKTALKTALVDKFPEDWWTSTESGSPPSEMITAITAVKAELIQYLDVANQVLAAWSTADYRMLAKETVELDGTEYSVVGYKYKHDLNVKLEDNMSYITKAIYSYLYSASTGETQDNEISLENLDLSNGALPIMANATLKSNGDLEYTGEKDLTLLGYYVLAAGATYDPFVSIAGNDTFMAALDQFLKDGSDQKEKIVRVLQTAINTRKPIYSTEANRGEWATASEVTKIPASNFSMATLSQLLASSENVSRAYVVVKGKMKESKVDSGTWEYVQGGSGGTTSSDDTTTVDVQGAELTTIGSEHLMASDSQISLPVAYSSGSSSLVTHGVSGVGACATIGGLTTAILHNAAMDLKSNQHVQNAETEFLFLNGLGDIVLSDGTIVLPAIANPILYEYGSTLQTSQDESDMALGYYPYTATMSNHYPAARTNADKKTFLNKSSDVGKYIFHKDNGSLTAVYIYETAAVTGQVKTRVTDQIRIARINGNSLSTSSDITALTEAYQYRESWNGNVVQRIDSFNFLRPDMYYLVYMQQATAEGIPLFPLQEDSADIRDSYLSIACPLITSAVRYISTSDATSDSVRSSSGTFRIESFIEDFMAQGMLGNAYSETMVKNYKMSYDSLVDDQYGRLTNLIKSLAVDCIDTLGQVSGVLAIQNCYENGFFNTLTDLIQRGYLIIAVVLLVVIAVKFLRGRYNMIYVAFIGLLVFSAFEVYAVWMPTAIPAAYNFFVNDVVEDIAWNTVAVKAESYQDTYRDSGRKDPQTGAPNPYTATITLYRMTQAEMQQIAERANVSEVDVKTGVPVYLDEQAGIFVQGDCIKMSLDRLLANNSMRGLYKSQWEEVGEGGGNIELVDYDINPENPYILKLTNPYVSLESYYTPFCQIERCFMTNLNNFANIFKVDRRTYNYGNYLYKDAFLFNAFTNSAIFTAPQDKTYETLRLNIKEDAIFGSKLATVEDVIELCKHHMEPFEDWLHLSEMFAEPSQAMRDSLWGQMLQKQGYYGSDWSINEEQREKIATLIAYINDQTKQFVIRNLDTLNFMSDENAIKMVSLFATTCFTHRVSEFGNWLYPNYINAADLQLSDVLYGSMTTIKDRNIAYDGNLVNTLTLHLGLWGAVLVLLITVLSAIFIFALTYLVPILYALFGVILVFKLLNDDPGVGLVKGYFKVTGITALLYIIYSFGLRLVATMGYQWYGYLGTLLITALCLYFLVFTCVAIATNPLELGNDNLGRTLFNAVDRLTGNRLSKLTSNSVNIFARHPYGGSNMMHARNYMRGASVDDRWSGRVPRRGEHYGRWSDFDDDGMSQRARVISRFGKMEQAAEVGTTRTGFRQSLVMRGMRGAQGAASKAVNRVKHAGGVAARNASIAFGDRFDNFKKHL